MKGPHWVPLSQPAMEVLQEVKKWRDPRSPWVFHQARSGKHMHQLTDVAMAHVLYDLDFRGKYVERQHVHGFRTLASTIANASDLWDADAIELQLSHAMKGVRGVYNHADKLPERRRMMDWWAEQVVEARAKHEVVVLERLARADGELFSDRFQDESAATA